MVDQAIATLHDQVLPGVVAAQQRVELVLRGEATAEALEDARRLLEEVSAVTHRLLGRLVLQRTIDLSGPLDLTQAPAEPSR